MKQTQLTDKGLQLTWTEQIEFPDITSGYPSYYGEKRTCLLTFEELEVIVNITRTVLPGYVEKKKQREQEARQQEIARLEEHLRQLKEKQS